jgi:DNA-binding phage protein
MAISSSEVREGEVAVTDMDHPGLAGSGYVHGSPYVKCMEAHNQRMPIKPAPEIMSQVIRSLQAEAERKELTSYALAKLMGLNHTTIDRALSGDVSPTLATVEAIAKALEFTVTAAPTPRKKPKP